MKNMSIKSRVTLWYTALMMVIVTLTLALLLAVSEYVFETQTQMTLIRAVENNVDEIEYEFGYLDIENDFYFFYDGVYSVVYDKNYTVVDGSYPDGFDIEVEFENMKTRRVVCHGEQYYVYDRLLTAQEYGYDDDVWVRGVIMLDRTDSIVAKIVQASFVLLPLLVIISVAVGMLIAKKAFEPVMKMTDTVKRISASGDLKQRVGVDEKGDEISVLANTFDAMLEVIENSFEAEKQFTSDASHELRTPVSVILAECELALECEQSTEEYIESLQVIQRQGKKMSELISQLLSFTRLEQGGYKPELMNENVSELVACVCEEQQHVNNGTVTMHTDIDEGIFMDIDVMLFMRMVENLVSNAYRYNKPDGTVTVSLKKRAHAVVLSVADTGVGISEEEIEKVWRRFYRGDTSRSTPGTGLGLSMVRQIAGIHGGEASLESTLGEGSVFSVSFPLE